MAIKKSRQLAVQAWCVPPNEGIEMDVGLAEAFADILDRETGKLQAKIDSLMMEYCPKEMTSDQIETWGDAQAPSPELDYEFIGWYHSHDRRVVSRKQTNDDVAVFKCNGVRK